MFLYYTPLTYIYILNTLTQTQYYRYRLATWSIVPIEWVKLSYNIISSIWVRNNCFAISCIRYYYNIKPLILPLSFCLYLSLCPYLFHRQYAKMKLIFAIHPRGGVLLECFAKTTRDGGGGVALFVLIIFAKRRRYPMVQRRKIIASTQTGWGTLTSTSYT